LTNFTRECRCLCVVGVDDDVVADVAGARITRHDGFHAAAASCEVISLKASLHPASLQLFQRGPSEF
jgi:hypothetical protein